MAEARNGSEALERALETKPAIVLMDISMPGMDGLEATRQLKQSCPNTQVLALTVHDDKQYFMQMLAAGASGYLTKLAAPDELVAAIHAVAEGNIYLQPALARWLIEDYQRLSDASTLPDVARRGPADGGHRTWTCSARVSVRCSSWLRRERATSRSAGNSG